MSILKFLNGKNCGDETLKAKLDYVLNPEKINRHLIGGNGLDVNRAYNDMMTIQTLYGKETGRRFIHYILSYDEDVELDVAADICEEVASYFSEDYQYIWAIHTNTNNIHMHVVINSVNVHTGKKFSQSQAELLKFRNFVNKIFDANKLNLIGRSFSDEEENVLSYPDDDVFLYEDLSYYDEDEAEHEFGFYADQDEVRQIEEAERYSALLKKAFAFFSGQIREFPEGIDYNEAEAAYLEIQEDKQEEERMEEAEAYSRDFKEIIAFFEGRCPNLPCGISYEEAQNEYQIWLDSQAEEEY